MKKERVQVLEVLQKNEKNNFPMTLEKDLLENEQICPVCQGLGIMAQTHRYGLVGDNSKDAKECAFPYQHQTFTLCSNCYNGVIRVCEYCGKHLPRGYSKCDCEQAIEQFELNEQEKYEQTIKNAQCVELDDVRTWLYDHSSEQYFQEIEDFVDFYESNQMCDNMPGVLWLCEQVKMSMDADDIIEQACEELHEDAMDNIDIADKEELQSFLDDWCRKQYGTITYRPTYDKYVLVDASWFANH